MNRAALIADDLTGACDSAVQLRKIGFETHVIVNPQSPYGFPPEGQSAIAVSSETRNMGAQEAYARVYEMALQLKAAGADWFYKKIDSVMRGNTGREIDAMLDALQCPLAVLTPAYPANGRILKEGALLVGSAQGEKAFPALSILRAGSRKRCEGLVKSEVFPFKRNSITRALLAKKEAGAQIILADCETEADLCELAAAINNLPFPTLSAGSAGLIWALGAHLNMAEGRVKTPAVWHSAGPILLTIGSCHPNTVHQLRRLRETGRLRGLLLKTDGLCEENAETRIQEAYESYLERPVGEKECLAITTESIYNNPLDMQYCLDANLYDARIARCLAAITKQVAAKSGGAKLILSGGATAYAVFAAFGIDAVRMIEEPMPGVVAGSAQAAGNALLVLTKSGGFGTEDTLVRLVEYLQQ